MHRKFTYQCVRRSGRCKNHGTRPRNQGSDTSGIPPLTATVASSVQHRVRAATIQDMTDATCGKHDTTKHCSTHSSQGNAKLRQVIPRTSGDAVTTCGMHEAMTERYTSQFKLKRSSKPPRFVVIPRLQAPPFRTLGETSRTQ